MKRLIITCGCQFLLILAYTQTMDELLRQKETQKKYLLKQIAALQTHIGHVKKGISIAKKGLTTISDLKNSELNIHRIFFSSLKEVNPEIKNFPRVAETIALQIKIIKSIKNTYKELRDTDLFDLTELDYISKAFSKVLAYSYEDIEQLTDVITSNLLEMKDDQRFERINSIYYRMQNHYRFAENFKAEARLLVIQRIKENSDIKTSRLINGIK